MGSNVVNARILVREATDRGFPVEIEGPGGEESGSNIPIEACAEVRTLLYQLQNLLGEEPVLPSPDVSVQIQAHVKTLGQYLFRSLGADKVRRVLDLSKLHPDERLRIELRIRANYAEAWPWELLHDSRTESEVGEFDLSFLALCPKVMLSRYYEKPEPVPRPEKVEKLRVLVIVASPHSYPPLDHAAQSEIEALKLTEGAMDRLELYVCKKATVDSLQRYLREAEHPFHIVHFIGHGYLNDFTSGEPPETGVVLESKTGRDHKVSARDFARMLQESQQKDSQRNENPDDSKLQAYPRLVTIDACLSARMTFSVARELVNYGVPAVIGVRDRVSPAFTLLFNTGLYAHLINGYPIDQAVAECRRKLKNEFERHYDWSTPVLYLRARDGVLFDFNPDSNEVKFWEDKIRLLKELAQVTGYQAEEATRALLKLGVSAIALSAAVVLAYPVAAVRASAAALLRALPRTPEIHENIVNLIGPALEYEPDVTVRREVARILAQPRISANAGHFLNMALTKDGDEEVRDIARAGLIIQQISERGGTEPEVFSLLSDVFLPSFGDDLNRLFDYVRNQLERVTAVLNQLATIVGDVLQGGEDYHTYLQQVEGAHTKARELQQLITQAQNDAAGMTANQVWDILRPQVAAWVENANRAIVAVDRAARAASSLASRLSLALDEVAKTLESELALMKDLDEITRGLDGTVISDVREDAKITIVRRDLDTGGEGDVR